MTNLTDEQINELNRRGLRLLTKSQCDEGDGQVYTMAWSSHLKRWEAQAAHIDKHLREVQT